MCRQCEHFNGNQKATPVDMTCDNNYDDISVSSSSFSDDNISATLLKQTTKDLSVGSKNHVESKNTNDVTTASIHSDSDDEPWYQIWKHSQMSMDTAIV